MSTRATIHFCDPESKKPTAIIYRHWDGYPDGLGKDLKQFIEEVRANVPDNRFHDPAYLAAKWVVWDAGQMAAVATKWKNPNGGARHPLNFLSVGVVDADPGDIEYRYKVVCDGKPTVTHEKV